MTTVNNQKNSPTEAEEIDLGRLIGELIDHRKLIIAVTSCVTFIALFYAILATPIYQSNALIQVEQKQGNAILSSLTQILPDAQPQSAPEIALLKSRMILGKTVDDLNLQTQVEPKHFPIIGDGIARLLGKENGHIDISTLYIPQNNGTKTPEIILTIKGAGEFEVESNSFTATGKVGELFQKDGVKLIVNGYDAKEGDRFVVKYFTRLKAISNLQDAFSVSDQGKDTGMLTLTLTGPKPKQISEVLNNISENYLEQNVA
ncbi:TPA: tyrosine-protein kinase, partial [Escherichia coli]|nr:tyrosine-protein kinase [Escherichia coli]